MYPNSLILAWLGSGRKAVTGKRKAAWRRYPGARIRSFTEPLYSTMCASGITNIRHLPSPVSTTAPKRKKGKKEIKCHKEKRGEMLSQNRCRSRASGRPSPELGAGWRPDAANQCAPQGCQWCCRGGTSRLVCARTSSALAGVMCSQRPAPYDIVMYICTKIHGHKYPRWSRSRHGRRSHDSEYRERCT